MFLGRKKLLEQVLVHFRVNAGAMIAHAQAHFAVPVASGANLDLALIGRCLPHGIKRIADQVNQDLLNLDRISFDWWQVFGQQCFYLAGMPHRIRSHDMRYLCDQFIQIDRASGRIAFLNCIAHVLDDFVGAVSVCNDVGQDLVQGRRVSLSPLNKPHSSIRIADDG